MFNIDFLNFVYIDSETSIQQCMGEKNCSIEDFVKYDLSRLTMMVLKNKSLNKKFCYVVVSLYIDNLITLSIIYDIISSELPAPTT